MTERQAIESTYEDTLSSFRRKNIRDEVTKQTRQEWIPILEDKPCALSHKDSKAVVSFGNHMGETDNEYVLFHAPELDVLEGDKLVITRLHGPVITCYPGKPFCYSSHAETWCSSKEKT